MPNESLRSTGLTSGDGMTCEPSRQQTEIGASMSSAVDSLARTSAVLDDVPESTESEAVFGLNTQESFAILDRDTSSWRTSQRCLFGGWREFSETWPRSGSMQSGTCYRRAPSVPHIHESACFSLPTPTKSDAGVGEIISECRPDAITGKPRKVNRNGKTWSAGLGRLFVIATGLPLHPNLSEWMIGFPKDWTALGHVETPSVPQSPSSSDAG